jgi:pilus assembly protein CpaB
MIFRLAFFVLMALGLAGFGSVAWIATRPPPPDAGTIAAALRVTVLVASNPVRAGTLLKPEDLTAKEVSAGEAGDDSSADNQDSRHALSGAMVRRGLAVNEVVRLKDVMRPGDHGFLAAVLGPGMRAVSVGVDTITGTAGLIWPGDHVDLILTQSIGDAAVPAGRRIAAETILSDVRVIAIDQQLVQGVAPDGNEGKARTVTIEVSSVEAERVAVASRIGRLSLAVQSVERTLALQPVSASKTTWASDVSPALGNDVAQGARSSLRVFTGAAEGKEYRF